MLLNFFISLDSCMLICFFSLPVISNILSFWKEGVFVLIRENEDEVVSLLFCEDDILFLLIYILNIQ